MHFVSAVKTSSVRHNTLNKITQHFHQESDKESSKQIHKKITQHRLIIHDRQILPLTGISISLLSSCDTHHHLLTHTIKDTSNAKRLMHLPSDLLRLTTKVHNLFKVILLDYLNGLSKMEMSSSFLIAAYNSQTGHLGQAEL